MNALTKVEETSPDASSAPDCDEFLSRYRRLRRITLEHHNACIRFTSHDLLLDRAKRIGLGNGRVVYETDATEMSLVYDLSIYTSLHGRTRAVDRYAKSANFAAGSDEGMLLAAMRQARFSVWEIKRRHPTAGLILSDVMRRTETWLMDINLAETAPACAMLGGRIIEVDGFSMGCGVFVPVSDDMLEAAVVDVPGPIDLATGVIAESPRFAMSLYREAISSGAIGQIDFRSVA